MDTYPKAAFAKLYDRQTPIAAADLLNDRALPFYAERDVPLSRVLTDRSNEFCGNRSSTHTSSISPSRTSITPASGPRAHRPSGICEFFRKMVLNEFCWVACRKKLYHSIAELQADRDTWVDCYNRNRLYQGRWCFGKTPTQTFLHTIPLAKEELMAA